MIIDLHAHLIPGVDDGAQTLEDSLLLAKQAVEEGVEHLVLTPHHYNNQYVNHAKDVVEAANQLQNALEKAGVSLNVYPSQEIRINEHLIDDLLNQDLLSLDDSGKYYLIEFPTQSIPDYSEQVLSQLVHRGITPVIAHPERNHVFVEDLQVYQNFIAMGCLGQITTSSIAGAFGTKIQTAAKQMIEKKLAHILASDAHSVEWRPFNYNDGLDALEKFFGEEKVQEFKENARSIFNGEELAYQYQPVQKVSHKKAKKKSIWNLFKK